MVLTTFELPIEKKKDQISALKYKPSHFLAPTS